MSLWHYFFDSDYIQRQDIERLRRKATLQSRSARGVRMAQARRIKNLSARVDELEEQIGTLTLLARGLVDTLRKRADWDEKLFRRVTADIDLEDGVTNGKSTPGRD